MMKQKYECKRTFSELGKLQEWEISKKKQNHPLQIGDSVNLVSADVSEPKEIW